MNFYLIAAIIWFLYTKSCAVNYTYNLNCKYSGYEKWLTTDNITCYYFSTYNQRENWHDSIEECKEKGGHLVSIHDNTTNQQLSLLSRRSYPYPYPTNYNAIYWIGLNSLSKRGYYEWADRTPRDFTSFPVNNGQIQQNIYLIGRCVYLRVTFQRNTYYSYWYFDDCNDEHNYICAKNFVKPVTTPATVTPKGNCPEGWLKYANEKCVKIIGAAKSWDNAKAQCLSSGAELLSIHSESEQNFITSIIADRPMPYIGLRRKSYYNRWSWDDQSRFDYDNWANQVSQDYSQLCIVLVTNEIQAGMWLMDRCDSNRTAICQKPTDARITKQSKSAFSNCTITGSESFVQYRNSCYLLVDYNADSRKDWESAEKQCNTLNNAHLVSIENSYEFAFLSHYTFQYGISDRYWIGFYSAEDESGLNTTQVFEWSDKWPNYFTNWAKREPAFNAGGNKVCVYQFRENGTWKTDNCSVSHAFVCKITNDELPQISSGRAMRGSCPQLNTTEQKQVWKDLDKRSKYCYWFSAELSFGQGLVSWSDASFHCRQRNATLVSVHSTHELLLLKKKITDARYNTWLGLYQVPDGDYVWEDGSAVDFTNWDENSNADEDNDDDNDDDDDDDDDEDEDNEEDRNEDDVCVEIESTNLLWYAARCAGYDVNRNYYICQTPKVFTSTSLSSEALAQSSGKIASAAVAGIVIAVLLLISIVSIFIIIAVRKNKIPNIVSFDNVLYAKRGKRLSDTNDDSVSFSPERRVN